jgi:hypothetical protein
VSAQTSEPCIERTKHGTNVTGTLPGGGVRLIGDPGLKASRSPTCDHLHIKHKTLAMTMVYARIADKTVAEEYFNVTEKVEALYGQPRQLSRDDGSSNDSITRRHDRPLDTITRTSTTRRGSPRSDTCPRASTNSTTVNPPS